ncbi:MAG: anti-sigma factor domain-containing protein [Actinomycetota bacterium]
MSEGERDHTRIEELIALRSLGGAETGDEQELTRLLAEHGPMCRECARLTAEYDEVAGRLAFAAAPEEVPEGMEDRVVDLAVSSRRRVRGIRSAGVAAAAAVLLLAGGIGGYLMAPSFSSGRTHAAVGYLSAPDVRIATLHGSGTGTVNLAYRPGSQASYLLASGLPDAPAGHVYEVWLFHGNMPQRAAVFVPDGGDAVERVGMDAGTASLVAITIERAPGADTPHGVGIFQAPIATQ